MSIDFAIAVLAAATAIASLVGFLVTFLNSRHATQQLEVALNQASFDSAVSTSKLEELGKLLEIELGAVSIDEYSQNSEIRDRFRSTFGAIAEYVGAAEEDGKIDSESIAAGDARELREDAARSGDSELNRAFFDILHGEVWNGLARARRRVESRLLEVANEHGIDIGEGYKGAGRLVRLLSARGIVSSTTESQLRYALGVANRGIHGSDVEVNEALESLGLIDHFLTEYSGNASGQAGT